jgi:ATP/maltotriose-dependent transcriptional regulator MalT
VLTVWTPLRVEAELLAGDLDAAAALARDNASSLAGERGHASTRALQLAEILLLKGEDEEAEQAIAAAERDALPSDVLVQFRRRSLRARLLARAGDVDAAEPLARAAVAIASRTDELCNRARAHFALAEVLELSGDVSTARAEEAEGNLLLLRKGVKGALVGAPSR